MTEFSAWLGVLTVIVAAGAAFVAHSTYQVNRAKFKFDLFEDRYEVFNVTWRFASNALSSELDIVKTVMDEMNIATTRAKFLFRPEVEAYMKDMSERSFEHNRLYSEFLQNPNDGPVRSALQTGMLKYEEWFRSEAKVGCKQVFAPYLDFSEWI